MRIVIPMTRAPLLAAAVLVPLLAGSATAAPLLQDLSDRTLSCAIEPPYYIAPKAESISVLRFGDADGAPWDDLTVALAAPALQKAEADRVEILLPATAGHAKPTLVAFVRTKEKDPGTGKTRTVISGHIDGDTVGDECAVDKGRAPYVTGRFNAVRENVCGNDAVANCASQLKTLCGPEPTFACTADAKPRLTKADKGK
ncbi:hypothetical protein [Azorhizobium sp. AG788]|uniref:hypothetical protein n=1 Tax=Azorhizobium sp. AG788 TaxID=2183897 RepID=UPI00313A3E50